MSLEPADRLEILGLAARADGCATARDPDGYAELFTDDAVMDGDQGTVNGREGLRAAVASVWQNEPAGTLHLTLNAVVDDTQEDPVVNSLLVLVAAGPAGLSIESADIRQAFRQTAAGWKIRSRTIRLRPSAGHA